MRSGARPRCWHSPNPWSRSTTIGGSGRTTTLLVVGDIDRPRLEEVLDVAMTRWTVADFPAPELPDLPGPPEAEGAAVLLHRGGTVQSKVFVAAPAPAAGADDLAAVAVLAEASELLGQLA